MLKVLLSLKGKLSEFLSMAQYVLNCLAQVEHPLPLLSGLAVWARELGDVPLTRAPIPVTALCPLELDTTQRSSSEYLHLGNWDFNI